MSAVARHGVCAISGGGACLRSVSLRLLTGGAVRLLVACLFAIVLLALVAQLHAISAPPTPPAVTDVDAVPLVVGTDWPWWEPFSLVFVLGGATAMGLWKAARKLKLI